MRILIAEDETDLSCAVAAVLEKSGCEVDTAENGLEALAKAEKNIYDVMLLDIMMPEMDGIEALRSIRGRGDTTPVILLTAKAEVEDRVLGLDSGADDYLPKPFAMKELLARIRSVSRRKEEYHPKMISAGGVLLDTAEQELSSRNSIHLSGTEARLMALFMMNQEKWFSTEELFMRIWKEEPDADSRIVWIYISYLRQKLSAIGADLRISGDEGGSFALGRKDA